MIKDSRFKVSDIKNAVKKIRAKYSHKNCPYKNQYSNVESQVRTLEHLLKINSTDHIFANITTSDLQLAGNFFLLLNSCSDLLKPWFSFYTNLFQNESPELIILQLNRILKNKKGTGSTDRNKMITIAEKIFKETSSLLSLKYQEIQNLIQGRRNVLWNKNDSLSGLYLDEDIKY